jgi:uncharacterized protein (UPF0261 family)
MTVYVIGTADTKAAELAYAKACVIAAGAAAILVDVGTRSQATDVDVTAAAVAAAHPRGAGAVLGQADRGVAITAMAEALTRWLSARRDVDAVLGLGGSGNTAIVTAAMRALPVGLPKLMVSTVASGQVAPYVGPSDIAMMNAVVDVAGLNAISRQVIGNAAHAIAGMALRRVATAAADKPGIGLTMFGVTTPCVTRVRERLEARFEPFVFHATGTGGQSMEKLVDSGLLKGVIDVTTTEVADFLVGGVLPCTDDRFGSYARTRIPAVVSVGALDMVNFGARDTVPEKFSGRKFHVHNPQVTLMRTTREENAEAGAWIAERLNRSEGPVRLLLPLGGVSAIDAPGEPFHDPDADASLFEAIRLVFAESDDHKLIALPHNINDPAFADALVENFLAIAG